LLYKYPQKLCIKIMVEATSKPEDEAIHRTTLPVLLLGADWPQVH
jgi:hypothetical protein